MEENTKAYIIDASFVLAYLLPDENVALVDRVFASQITGKFMLHAPSLLSFEVTNGLYAAYLKKNNTSCCARVIGNIFVVSHNTPYCFLSKSASPCKETPPISL